MPAAILAFDTTHQACSVALRSASEIICEQRSEPRAHARILLPMIDSVLARAAMTLKDLDAVAFAQGPGSFTGVRMAASVAQGLAFGAQLPVIPVSSLATLAQACANNVADELIVPVTDAHMGEVYAGFYALQKTLVLARYADSLLAPHALTEKLAKIFPGRALYAVGDAWSLLETNGLQVDKHDADAISRADNLLLLAEQAWSEGKTLPAEQALPVYLRDSSAWKKMSAVRQSV